MIISVISGKGGTGKTTVAVNLALSAGRELSLIDCDVEGPNADLFLPIRYHSSRSFSMKTPVIDRGRCTLCGKCSAFCAYNALAVLEEKVLVFPDLCHSCLGCACLCPEKAISFRERPVGKIEQGEVPERDGGALLHFIRGEALVAEHRAKFLIRRVKEYIYKGLDAIIDAPPGTVLAAEAMRGTDLSLIVAEPTRFGLSDLARIHALSQAMELPAAVIINKSGDSDFLIEDFCTAQNISVIGKVPQDPRIASRYAQGIAISLEQESYRDLFRAFPARITASLCGHH
jgi:MinD superfamily P-loop ATPase